MIVGCLLILASVTAVRSQAQVERKTFEVGAIDFFGYGGLDLQAVREKLPIHVGQSINPDKFEGHEEAAVEREVQRVTGRPPTEVGIVCCGDENRLLIYIGLAGSSTRPLITSPAPNGSEHLDPQALKLYDEFETAASKAISRGDSQEDWSQGYALLADPAVHAIQLKVRAYAIDKEAEFEAVLRHSASAKQRAISAYLLGYAKRSATQIQALLDATLDGSSEVRNNATRALGVLESATDSGPLEVDLEPLIAMLYSGHWTDRNKASFLLSALTVQRDSAMLDQLRKDALPPLVEGARWKNPGHADAFLEILGRIGNLPETEIQELAKTNKEKIIQAACPSCEELK